MSELLKLVEGIFARGRYSESLHNLQQIPTDARTESANCLLCECLQFTGEYDQAFRQARRSIEDLSLPKVLRARYFGVIGRIRSDQYRREEAAATFAQGMQILARTEEHQALWNLQQLWLISVAGVSDSLLASATRQAYRTAIKSADSSAIAGFHVRLGQLEGERGAFSIAMHHLDLAESILDRSDHTALRGSMYVNRSCVLALKGDFEAARKDAEAGALYAEQAGYLRLSMAASACVAHCATAMGDVTVAESWLKRGAGLMKRLGLLEGSFFESLAILELVRGNHEKARMHLRSLPQLSDDSTWVASGRAYNLLTELELYKKPHSGSERHRVLGALRAVCELQRDRHLSVATRLAEAEFAFDEAEIDRAKRLVLDAVREAHGRVLYRSDVNRLIARALWVEGFPAAAHRRLLRASTAAYLRGTRLTWGQALRESLSVIGPDSLATAYSIDEQVERANAQFGRSSNESNDLTSTWFQDHPQSESTMGPSRLDGFDDAVGILDCLGDSELRGREAFAAVVSLGIASKAALSRRNSAGNRTITRFNWTEDGSVAPPNTNNDIFVFEVGEDSAGSIELLVTPRAGTRALLALEGVRVLIEAAKAAESQGRHRERLDALWDSEAVSEEPGAVFTSPQTIELVQTARKVGATSLPVLLLGDTGTGKEVLARAIHRASPRARNVFLAFNCSAVPRDMVESQLFGYRRGSFTGAVVDFLGIIRSAEGGTLFLDEVGELPLDIQPKLLRFLETNEVHPLGEGRPIKVDVRVIAATNADLEVLIQRRLFREDLYYRLNIALFHMPRLAERREEVPQIALHMLRRFQADEKKHGITISDEVMEYLVLYDWPGNVRQLSNELRKMVAFVGNGQMLSVEHLSPAISASRRTGPFGNAAQHDDAPPPAPPPSTTDLSINLDQPMPDAVEALERAMIEHAIARAGGKIEEAARLLGISRKGLFLKRRRSQKAE